MKLGARTRDDLAAIAVGAVVAMGVAVWLRATPGARLSALLPRALAPSAAPSAHSPPVRYRTGDAGRGAPSRSNPFAVDACPTGITLHPPTGNDDPVVRLRRGGCRGSCPVYVVTIYADGRVHFEGMSVDGVPEGRITRGQLNELIGRFRGSGFFELCDPKPRMTDVPRMDLEFWDGTRVKRVRASWPATAQLQELGEAVDRAADIEHVLTHGGE